MLRGLTFFGAAMVLTTALFAATPAPLLAQEDAQRLYSRGAAAYGDGRFAEAAALFEQAYALRPDAPLLYNLGLALEQGAEVTRAIEAYERFLAASPDAAERTEVERSLSTLRRQQALVQSLAHQPEARARSPVEPVAEPIAEPVVAAAEPAPWIIVGIGAASLIAGAVVAVLAQADYDTARTEPEHLRATRLEQSANDLGLGATALFAAGGVVLGAGLLWGIIDLVTRGSGTAEVRVGIGDVSVSGTF